jgi:hypothetical protein
VTEGEAKTKSCCGGGNTPLMRGSCIASACMAWRWNGYRAEDGKWVQISAPDTKFAKELGEGYCGLASKP